MSIPLSVILKELEGPKVSVLPIISSLYYDKSILNGITKAELRHLVSRTLNLAKSPIELYRWSGINLIRVLGANYNILASDGAAFFEQLIKILETLNESSNRNILTSTIECINFLCSKIRGKPTLTREILTPKLAILIPLYLEKLHLEPLLITKSMKTLVHHHPTTFRPFGNKLRARLMGFLVLNDFASFPLSLKNAIYSTLAVLPAIEKVDPELKWETDVRDIIKEIVSVLEIYQEFLNLTDDGDLMKLFHKVPKYEEGAERVFPTLLIDVNDLNSILQISNRIEVLLRLLSTIVTTETQFSVKVPFGLLIAVNEIICSLNLRFVSFKGDIRDEAIRKLIKSTTIRNQLNAIKFLNKLAVSYKGSVLPHLSNILSFLEVLIPFNNKRIDYTELIGNEVFYCELITCVSTHLSLVSNLGDNSQLLRFVDISLLLVEPRLDAPATATTKNNAPNQKKAKKKKNTHAVPLSDLLSHQHLFTESIPASTVKSVREFLSVIITTVVLPPTQHYKIMRYLIIESVNAKYYNVERAVPAELRNLLVNAVLYPGYEKISLLPIVSSILPNDKLLSVFNNPRFPPLPVYIKQDVLEQEQEQEDEEEEEEDDEEVAQDEPQSKRRKLSSSGEAASGTDSSAGSVAPVPYVEIEDKERLFTKVDPEQVIQFAPKTTQTSSNGSKAVTEPVVEQAPTIVATSTATTVTTISKDEDSDFEMPEIAISDDEDDE